MYHGRKMVASSPACRIASSALVRFMLRDGKASRIDVVVWAHRPLRPLDGHFVNTTPELHGSLIYFDKTTHSVNLEEDEGAGRNQAGGNGRMGS